MVLEVDDAARLAFAGERTWRAVVDDYREEAMRLLGDSRRLGEEKQAAAKSSDMESGIFGELDLNEVLFLYCNQRFNNGWLMQAWERILHQGTFARVCALLSPLAHHEQLATFERLATSNDQFTDRLHCHFLDTVGKEMPWQDEEQAIAKVLESFFGFNQYQEERILAWHSLAIIARVRRGALSPV